MAVFNGAFPIVAGKVQAARDFANETMGARRSDFEDAQRRWNVTRETWSIQETTDGNAFALVWFESPDPEKAFADTAQDPSDFGAWFREQVKEINGIDLADPSQPLQWPEVILDWPERPATGRPIV